MEDTVVIHITAATEDIALTDMADMVGYSPYGYGGYGYGGYGYGGYGYGGYGYQDMMEYSLTRIRCSK